MDKIIAWDNETWSVGQKVGYKDFVSLGDFKGTITEFVSANICKVSWDCPNKVIGLEFIPELRKLSTVYH